MGRGGLSPAAFVAAGSVPPRRLSVFVCGARALRTTRRPCASCLGSAGDEELVPIHGVQASLLAASQSGPGLPRCPWAVLGGLGLLARQPLLREVPRRVERIVASACAWITSESLVCAGETCHRGLAPWFRSLGMFRALSSSWFAASASGSSTVFYICAVPL